MLVRTKPAQADADAIPPSADGGAVRLDILSAKASGWAPNAASVAAGPPNTDPTGPRGDHLTALGLVT
ncbi:hypothetical protein ACQP2F_04615 [Actinoplanes sp. CA-030573]|uniref:hypothetical protein n=1 Tax=Actinoplanes sp. CA-030573 TaxID=3239898 RepID=UPI003D8EB166